MRRFLLVFCWVAAAWELSAREPGASFDLPFTVEHGKYVVTVETAVGPRRFIFDTGASQTTVSEKLCRELGLSAVGRSATSDFEGHRYPVDRVRIPALRMGDATYKNVWAILLPDSSYIFRCLGFDGLVGSDLLRGFVVRMPNPDSTITLATDRRLVGNPDRAAGIRMVGKSRPVIPVHAGNGKRRMKAYVLFDTGSASLFKCRYGDSRALDEAGVLRDARYTVGHSGNLGWTNRSVVREAIHALVPEFEIAGNKLRGVPLEVTHGTTNKIGCGLFRWGTVVIDFPARRFWLLPHAEQPAPPDASVQNVTATLDGGRLVVGQVWDESLAEVVAPGDRIVRLGTVDVSQIDPCAVVRGEVRGDKPEMTIERSDGSRVTIGLKNVE